MEKDKTEGRREEEFVNLSFILSHNRTIICFILRQQRNPRSSIIISSHYFVLVL